MPRARTALAVLALALAGVGLGAHDTWLAPAGPGRPTGADLRLHLTSSGAFPAPEHAIEPDRLAVARLRVGSQVVPLRPVAGRSDVLVLEVPSPPQGLATAWVALKPRPLELTAAQVDEYLREIGESERIGERWARGPGPKRWRETYRKHAKTFVTVGQAPSDGSWRDPVGLALEIVPESPALALAAGDTLAVRVLKDGAPLPGLAIRAARAGSAGTVQRTDAAGRVSFRLDAPGAWLLAGTELRESADRPGEWESDFTTLTIAVAAARPAS